MSYTVGLDFGTHQTKICIEDASNPAQKIYEFLEHEDSNGNKSVLFPSIVQINIDDTLSYGYVDEGKCKLMPYSNLTEPKLVIPAAPILDLPQKPQKKYPIKPIKYDLKGYSLKDQLAYLKKYESECSQWVESCKKIDEKYNQDIVDWDFECIAIYNDYDYDRQEYQSIVEQIKKKYEVELQIWKSKSIPRYQIFRYFKLATFYSRTWYNQIRPEIISVWYLTFLLFKIQEKIGCDFYTQLGVPYSVNSTKSSSQKDMAYRVLLAAHRLLSEYKNLETFLNEKYSELLLKTKLDKSSDIEIIEFGINVLPEAFAGLTSITQQGRLSRGMHLLVDIGGGTTDIAFFTLTDSNLPDIHAVHSIPQGLNFIFENFIEANNSFSFEQARSLFSENTRTFNKSIVLYRKMLKDETEKLIKRIENEFRERQSFHGLEISRLRNALTARPVVYCGGGAMYDPMRSTLFYFTDIRLISKNLLNIPYVKNANIEPAIYSILATSYGLSIQLEDEIQMTPIEKVFSHLPHKVEDRANDWHNEHGLADT
jgi:hypothetical protein